jgi:nucleotide-binding universal stress UspA family protein
MVAEGEADRKIVEIAETQDFHLIMMCSHGMGPAKRLLIGSTTNKVIHHSNIPVLVIK